jgi:hypothetical protein
VDREAGADVAIPSLARAIVQYTTLETLEEAMASHEIHAHHEKAAEHHEHAAKHHREAAKHFKDGDHAKAAHHSKIAHGHSLHATEHHGHAAKLHADEHG